MAVNFLLKRSNTASKRPTAAQLDIGELSLNYAANTAGVFFEDSAGNVRKVGPVEVSTTAPNASPAGSSGNSLGELWFDSTASVTNLKVWNGSAFVNAAAGALALAAETFSTSATVTAGTNAQGQGALTSDYNIITTAAANPSGVTLPTATTGRRVIIVNKGANPVNVYPATGASIDALAANASIQLAVNSVMMLNAASTILWYSSANMQTLAAVADGDKGDITVSGSGATWTIDNTAVTYAKIQNVSTNNRILGRSTAGAGSIEELTTIPSTVLGNSSLFVGTTSIALNRASASQALTGITSIDGSAATLTTTRTLWGQNFNGSANVTGSLTSVTDITATGTIAGGTFVPSSSTAPTNGLYLSAANTVGLATNSTERLTINSAGRIIHSTSTSSGGGGFITRTGSGATDSAIILTGTGSTFGNYIFSVEGDLSGNLPLTLRASSHEIGDGTTNFLTASSASVSLLSTAATALNLNSGTTGAVTLDSGTTGAVNIGNNANAKTITLGNTTGATTINVNSGTGGILVTSPHLTMANQGEVRFREQTANGTNYIGLEAPASVAADLIFLLPGTDGTTTSGYTLKSNGSAALSFGTANIVTSDTAPSSPLDGDLWYNSANGRLFVYYSDANTNQWVDAAPNNSIANIKQIDNLATSFNGTTTAFTLQIGGTNFTPVSATQLLIAVGGVLQTPGLGYTVSGSTITFTSAPPSGATFSGIVLAEAGFFAAGGSTTQVQYNNAGTLAGTSLMTITTSVNVAADILPTTDNVRNLGSAALRFANVYTGDLHLKNDRGDWTIIEEEDCLTMRNNKTGKVYNIMMTERNA